MKKYHVLILDALEFLILNDTTLWPARRAYALKALIELYEDYLKELPEGAACRELIVKGSKNDIKRFKKMLKELQS